jgi:hypothetical protein
MQKIMDVLTVLEGKKTYIVAFLAGAIGLFQAVAGVAVPEYVYLILSALGLGAVRNSIK